MGHSPGKMVMMAALRTKITIKAAMYRGWFDVGPTVEHISKGLKAACLTMRSSSPFYDANEWVDRNGNENMMTAHSCLPDDFESKMCEETGLNIQEHDTHYILQFLIQFPKHPSGTQMKQTVRKLEKFVNKHFKPYVPDTKAADTKTG
jgi:hypothetical protein